MVVNYNGNKVQLPTDNGTSRTVFVKSEKNKYNIVDESEYKKSTKKIKTQRQKRQIWLMTLL